jgi:hypothetical protein
LLREAAADRAPGDFDQRWYAALVAAAGYLPVTLTGEDYLELLPVAWRAISGYGIQIHYRTYDARGLGPYRFATPSA